MIDIYLQNYSTLTIFLTLIFEIEIKNLINFKQESVVHIMHHNIGTIDTVFILLKCLILMTIVIQKLIQTLSCFRTYVQIKILFVRL